MVGYSLQVHQIHPIAAGFFDQLLGELVVACDLSVAGFEESLIVCSLSANSKTESACLAKISQRDGVARIGWV